MSSSLSSFLSYFSSSPSSPGARRGDFSAMEGAQTQQGMDGHTREDEDAYGAGAGDGDGDGGAPVVDLFPLSDSNELGHFSYPLLPHAQYIYEEDFPDANSQPPPQHLSSLLNPPPLASIRIDFSSNSSLVHSLGNSLWSLGHTLNAALEEDAIQHDDNRGETMATAGAAGTGMAEDPTPLIRAYISRLGPAVRVYEANHRQTAATEAGKRTSEASAAEAAQQLEECLQTVPAKYFYDSYDVGAALVQAIDQGNGAELSGHLDSVEQTLFTQLSHRSHAFFSSLHTIQSVHHEIADSVSSIKVIRHSMRAVHERLVASGLTLTQRIHSRNNHERMIALMELIDTVVKTIPTVKLLLAGCDYGSALSLMKSTQRVVNNELRGIKALKNIEPKLQEMAKLIIKLMEADFLQLALGPLNGAADAGGRLSATLADDERDRLMSIGENLWLMGELAGVVAAYKRELLKLLKQRLMAQVQSLLKAIEERRPRSRTAAPVTNVAQPVSASPAPAPAPTISTRLQQLSADEFIDFLGPLFATLMEPIKRGESIKALLDPLLAALPVEDADALPQLLSAFHGVLLSALEFSHSKVAKIVHTRHPQHSLYALPQLREFLDFLVARIEQAESVAGQHLYSLRTVLLLQCKSFIGLFHQAQSAALSAALDGESWTRVSDVPIMYQHIIEQNMHNKKKIDAHSQGADNAVARYLFVSAEFSPSGAAVGTRYLKFPVVACVLRLLLLVSDYLDYLDHFPAIGLEILNRLLELLALFNSRVCQLVLGAGAMHVAGLKSITATHLALAGQAIGLILSLMPLMRALFSASLSSPHQVNLSGFDRLQRDFDEHQKEVHHKLALIMKELIETMARKYFSHVNSQYANMADPGAGSVLSSELDLDPSMKTLMKQTCSLHRALTDLFSLEQRDRLFAQVSIVFRDVFASLLAKSPVLLALPSCPLALAIRIRATLSLNLSHVLSRLRTCNGVNIEIIEQTLGPFIHSDQQQTNIQPQQQTQATGDSMEAS